MTIEEAFELFARHGGVTSNIEELRTHKPSPVELTEATRAMVRNGVGLMVADSAKEAVERYFDELAP